MNPLGSLIKTASDIGASTRELDIRARERRAFPSRQQMVERIKDHVYPESWPLVEALLIGILVDASLPEDAEPMARCKQCGHIFELPVLICECPRPECKSRYIERVVI